MFKMHACWYTYIKKFLLAVYILIVVPTYDATIVWQIKDWFLYGLYLSILFYIFTLVKIIVASTQLLYQTLFGHSCAYRALYKSNTSIQACMPHHPEKTSVKTSLE